MAYFCEEKETDKNNRKEDENKFERIKKHTIFYSATDYVA